ncbi:MAG: GNAT family N-acetyltransferase [Spirochaetaceae bacterium]|nr:GNAT family N-acetyltransferase [Spirochaetaceae bacterium]
MKWSPAGRSSGKQLIRWLENNEWKHIPLSSRIKDSGGHPAFGKIACGRLWTRKDSGRITGVLYISRYGVVLPVFDRNENDADETQFLKKLLVSRENDLFSVIGMEERVLNIENHTRKPVSDYVNYRILVGSGPVPSEQGEPPELSIQPAELSDFDMLWKLEKAYQIEEVLRNGHKFDERSSRLHFQNTLKKQIVYYALLGGRAVARAGTNARGYLYDQIGGVFVIPELRGYGFGTAVMNRLLSTIAEADRRPCLFVKKSNLPALKLYKNLAFRDMGAFRISYYH